MRETRQDSVKKYEEMKGDNVQAHRENESGECEDLNKK